MKAFIKVCLITFIFNASDSYSQTDLKPKAVMETDKTKLNKLEVLSVTRKLTELMIDRNILEIDKILDKNFTLTHITGYVQSKEEWFSEIQTERMKYYSYKEVKTVVNIDGDRAIFIGQNLLDARIWGTRNKWRLEQTMQLKKRNGRWIILKSVAATF